MNQAEFVPVLRKTKGFCSNCLRMAIMIEKNVDVDSDGERVDFNDSATYEFLFKDYYLEIVKDKEGMTLDKLEEAYASMKSGLNCKRGPDLEKVHDEECSSDDDFVGKSDDEDVEPSSLVKSNGTSKKIKSFLKECKSVKNDYVGWGSKKLIEFLFSIGRDTSCSLDQFGAAEVVKEYIQQKNLLPKTKKKVVICDDRLKALFRKSKVRYNRIHSLLEKHIAANMITSEDETLASSEDDIESFVTKKARVMSYGSSSLTPKCTPEINKSCFASLVRDNIVLIYLKRSLVVELLKEPDTFESKVVGCFVRIKNDPKDYSFYMHKKLFQLGLVTGVRKTSEEYKIKDISTDVLLCISSIPDVKISMLSDEDFDEEECQDLRLLAQNESFKRPTVGDLEEKARSLRRDIMSHWINKELKRLDRLIDKASEKGWHREKVEYLDKKQLLGKPAEQQRLLEEVPQVIPEIEDSKDTELQVGTQHKPAKKSIATFQGDTPRNLIGSNGESVVSLRRCSEETYKETNGTRPSFLKSCADQKFKATNAYTDGGVAETHTQKQDIKATEANNAGDIPFVHAATEANNAGDIPFVKRLDVEGAKAITDGGTPGTGVKRQRTEATKANTAGAAPGTFVQKQCTKGIDVITIEDDANDCSDKGGQTAVVDLDADDTRDTHLLQHEKNRGHRDMKVERASQRGCIWYYIDPQGDEQGPFAMEHLRTWRNNGFFPDDFKVWRTGQASNDAILLIDALQMTS